MLPWILKVENKNKTHKKYFGKIERIFKGKIIIFNVQVQYIRCEY
jgi:hypothetical protein